MSIVFRKFFLMDILNKKLRNKLYVESKINEEQSNVFLFKMFQVISTNEEHKKKIKCLVCWKIKHFY